MGRPQFSFTLEEKEDTKGRVYLFASLAPFLNMVLFIRPEDDTGESPYWHAELKPYTGQQNRQPERARITRKDRR